MNDGDRAFAVGVEDQLAIGVEGCRVDVISRSAPW